MPGPGAIIPSLSFVPVFSSGNTSSLKTDQISMRMLLM